VKPGTESGRLSDEIKARLRDGSPDQAERDAAIARFHQADERVIRFRYEHLGDLEDEIDRKRSEPARRALVAQRWR
jgi:hypothetical protein